MKPELAMGPVLFHWPVEKKRDFWFRVADEAPVAVACLGEAICSKREPFFADHLNRIAERLQRGGKRVVWSSLAQVVTGIDRKVSTSLAELPDAMIEANDASILPALRGRSHHIGPYLNVYNEGSIAHLAANGAVSFSLQPELPAAAVARLTAAAKRAGATTEVQVFGRVSLALSARCYHARAHGRTKDNCLFVCENDPDGMELETRSRQKFLVVNGIQTMSHRYLELSGEMDKLTTMGVSSFRLSPHDVDIVAVSQVYSGQIDGRHSAGETASRLAELGLPQPTMNGFFHHKPGFMRIGAQAGLS